MSNDFARERLNSINSLFDNTGWLFLVEELEAEIEDVKALIVYSSTPDKVPELRGMLNQLEQFRDLPEKIGILLQEAEETDDANV